MRGTQLHSFWYNWGLNFGKWDLASCVILLKNWRKIGLEDILGKRPPLFASYINKQKQMLDTKHGLDKKCEMIQV